MFIHMHFCIFLASSGAQFFLNVGHYEKNRNKVTNLIRTF